MKRVEHVDITPDRSIMLKLGQAGYTLSEALAELIDNSIDAVSDKLHINITLRNGQVRISDNGSGMNKETAAQVLKLGFSTKEKETKLGKFGLGLKTSCLSIGKTFSIVTKQAASTEEYSISFDEHTWMKSGDWTKQELYINSVQSTESYTHVTISNLLVHITDKECEKLVREFGLRFGPFIQHNVTISVNGKLCEPAIPKLTRQGKQEFSLKLPHGTIKGWFGYKLAGAVKEYYGFNTFRLGRLITTHDKIGLTKDSKAKQIVGELYLDNVPVSHNKRQWITQSPEYKAVEQALTQFIRNYDVRHQKIISGFAANPGRVEGIARVLYLGVQTTTKDLERIKPGDIIVTGMTRPQYLLQIRRAGAIVTDQGGMLCHAAIVSREFNIPCIVGTQHGMEKIKDGQRIIVDANEGVIYAAD
ncbi:MAG TPA: PEP-utilizing enzyme [Candidatus Nanoarchaeia archaeon]|nr:PEP-utilizing enzyme [Candidatus Nanoarchaeia archaeon]